MKEWDANHPGHKILEVETRKDRIGIRFEGEDIESFKGMFEEKLLI